LQRKQHPQGQKLVDYIKKFGRDHRHLAAGKTKMAAWFVSNCNTPAGREKLVAKLKKQNILVDVYGACGDKVCPKSEVPFYYRYI
jgi:alpha-1,3-fucosyltransferase